MDQTPPPFLYSQNEDLISSTSYYPPQPYGIEYEQHYGATQEPYLSPTHYDSFNNDLYCYNNNNNNCSADEEPTYYKNLDISNYVPYKSDHEIVPTKTEIKNEDSLIVNNFHSESTVNLDYLPHQPDGKLTSNHVRSLSQLCPPYPEVVDEQKVEGSYQVCLCLRNF